jgi:hypothetical protein
MDFDTRNSITISRMTFGNYLISRTGQAHRFDQANPVAHMLDIPRASYRQRLVGWGMRPAAAQIDGPRLPVAHLPPSLWGHPVGESAYIMSQAIFLRGFAPAEGELPMRISSRASALCGSSSSK